MAYVILIFLVISWIEVPSLVKEKKKKELVLVSFILCLGFVLSILYVLGINLPSPIVAIENFLKNVLHLGYQN